MRAPGLLPVIVAVATLLVTSVFGQTGGTKAKASLAVTFEAHNEGAVEGDIYGDANLVSVTIDKEGIRYQSKSMDKPTVITWVQVSGWQANSFTSSKPSRTAAGDFGIGIYQNQLYLSFRTRNGRDYAAAIKALRAFALSKERSGIG